MCTLGDGVWSLDLLASAMVTKMFFLANPYIRSDKEDQTFVCDGLPRRRSWKHLILYGQVDNDNDHC